MRSFGSVLGGLLRFGVSHKREWLYLLPHKVRDVVKLQSPHDKPYVLIDRKKIDLPMDTYLANVRAPDVQNFLKFYDRQFNCFYNSTPVSRVISESFFLGIEEDLYFVMNQDSLLPEPESPLYEQTTASAVLEPIVRTSLGQVRRAESIPRGALTNTIIKSVMEHSTDLKVEKKMYKEMLKLVQKKVAAMEEDIREAEAKLKQRAVRRVRWFSNFIIAEVALLHYFIYFNLSWDIMEPITVILANIDIFFAYWFFILKGRNYSPQNWQEHIYQRSKFNHLRSEGIDVEKYQEYLELQEDLRGRLMFLTRNPSLFLEHCEGSLRLLDNSE
jgi:hypothetical protein